MIDRGPTIPLNSRVDVRDLATIIRAWEVQGEPLDASRGPGGMVRRAMREYAEQLREQHKDAAVEVLVDDVSLAYAELLHYFHDCKSVTAPPKRLLRKIEREVRND